MKIIEKILSKTLISIIKTYKYLISPLLGPNCRFLPTCSNYFIESIQKKGFLIGSYSGMKRILKCHPIKFLGGSSGFDPVENKDGK
ncbi:MAG: membrane protein insertion efficiency factor YidD [Candidatus Pelagibacter sp.]|nr:membrane protein insertion efficiency factor YidD [Candidatus Pelagibacter sp.]OUV86721.1 MAG: membrane protein insertion efficiency factor YidD [Pelagibacteraceae bacterium TMED136]